MIYKETWIHHILVLFLLFCLVVQRADAQFQAQYPQAYRWADSVLQKITLDEKIGQLFMIAAYSESDRQNTSNILYQIRNFHVGGIIFMQGTPQEQVRLTNTYQSATRLPLWIGQDAEWGLSMRLQNTVQFPKNLTLGAIRDDSLLYDLGYELGLELYRIGVQVNFAPVVDINNNPRNPVINERSFGENKFRVSRKGLMVSKGMEHAGIMPCIKHFPGHGDTDADSHLELPVMHQSMERMDTLELYPFAQLVKAGIPSVMVAHLHVPHLDSTQNQASSLSPIVINGILREKLGFDGVVFSDALNMKGVTRFFAPGELEVKALKAGNDVLLFPESIPKAFEEIKRAIQSQEFSEADLDEHVKRILIAKYRLGVHKPFRVSEKNLIRELNPYDADLLNKKLYESALTLAKNDTRTLPMGNLENRTIAYIQIGGQKGDLFERTLRKYAQIDAFYLPKNFSSNDRLELLQKTADYNTIITGIYDMNAYGRYNYGVREETMRLCEEITQRNVTSILTLFGNPYSLKFFGNEDAILVAYEPAKEAQRAAASAIFGGLRVDGRLPVTASPDFPEGTGYILDEQVRFGFSYPEEEGMYGPTLKKIDSTINVYLRKRAMPGCGVLVVKNDQIVYERGFGYTQPRGAPIDPFFHIYDLASITKIAATTLSTMRLVDQGRLNLDRAIGYYLPELRGTSLSNITPRRLLQHTAGLPGWIPFYQETYQNPRSKQLSPFYYSVRPTRTHTLRIAPRLYVNEAVQDSMWERIKGLEARRTTRMRYSDIGMILLAKVIEHITRESLDNFVSYNFYRPLGMSETTFNPFLKGWANRCPPTENDDFWRFTKIQGYVHDPASALMGGVAGHAGLFSNVYDLAKLMMMLKNEGRYGDRFYIKPSTIDQFTQRQTSSSRRGLGFDKPEVFKYRRNPVSDYASSGTFGHTGFTGTAVWVDPQFDLIYIFLSNRTYPDAQNRTLIHENVRSKVMETIYESIFQYRRDVATNP